MQTEIELAWSAGFFDGEGSTSIRYSGRSKLANIRVNVTQVHLEPLDRFLAAVIEGRIRGPIQPKGLSKQAFYRYAVTGDAAVRVLERLWPYLSSIKQNQAKAALDTWLRRFDDAGPPNGSETAAGSSQCGLFPLSDVYRGDGFGRLRDGKRVF